MSWFEVSNDGWRRLHASRPLGALVCEALQNALDEDVTRVAVTVGPSEITIEDDGGRDFADPRLVYTIFLTDKAESPTVRGRQGRGLKELISAMERAEVETPGFTVRFDRDGRHEEGPRRDTGTLLRLWRTSNDDEIAAAVATLRLIVPPDNVAITINGQKLGAPALHATLPDCLLPTVLSRDGVEQLIERSTAVRLFHLRRGERAHLFEMGLPVSPTPTPWHVDVGQRVPRESGGHAVDEDYRLRLLATLVESMIGGELATENLADPWVQEVLAANLVSEAALRTYVRRVFPERAVLPAASHDDERARQEGARVIDTATVSPRVLATLSHVMESSQTYVARHQRTAEEVKALKPSEERVLAFYRHLAKQILGQSIKIRLVRRPPSSDGFVEDATFDRDRSELRINLEGHWDLEKPLSPSSLGIFFHELAHAHASEQSCSNASGWFKYR